VTKLNSRSGYWKAELFWWSVSSRSGKSLPPYRLCNADYISSFSGAFFVLLYYLPIYFQAIDGSTAQQSGIRNLPLIIAMSEYLPI
jgi:hypothetical protein